MTWAIFPVSVKSGACCLFPLLLLPLVPPEPVSSTSRRTLLLYGYIVCRTSVDDKPPFQERKEHIMDLGTKVLLISGGFFLFALILGLFGKKMNDD